MAQIGELSFQNDYQVRVKTDLQSINGPLCFANVTDTFQGGPRALKSGPNNL